MDCPRIKQEFEPGRVSLTSSQAKRGLDHVAALQSSFEVKSEPQESAKPHIDRLGGSRGQLSLEPGEIPSTPLPHQPRVFSSKTKYSDARRSSSKTAHRQRTGSARASRPPIRSSNHVTLSRSEKTLRIACPQTPNKPLTSVPSRSLEPGDVSLIGTAPPTVPTLPPRVGIVNQGLLERLSRECQLRRFNLVWVFRPSRNGRFKFDIILHNHIIKADSEFDTEHWAKMAVAEKALRVVKSWPVGCLPPPPDLRTTERHQMASMLSTRQPNATVSKKAGESDGGRGRLAVKQERSPPMTPGQERAVVSWADLGQKLDGATSHPKSMPTMATAKGDPAREQADLLEHVRRVMGISLPGAITDSPEVAKAFLEGLAVGARLAGARVSTFSFRGRSESPVRASPETYRARSPSARTKD